MSQYAKYTEPSPQWLQFVSHFPELGDLDRVGIVERRRIFDHIEANSPQRQVPDDVRDDRVTVKSFTITGRDGHEIPVRTYVPVGGADAQSRPVLVYLHAGAWMFGDLDSGDLNCRILAIRLDISVLNVGYRLAPQWPFPAGLNDSYDATVWAAANAEAHLNASAEAGFIVGGISSGANFAGVIAYTARDAGLSPPITGLWISIPVCIMPDAYQSLAPDLRSQLLSMQTNNANPMLTRKSLGDIQKIYACPPTDPRVSFLLNPDHTRLPGRAYLQICGADPLRDEAFLWRDLLRAHSAAATRVDVYPGQPHGFWRFLYMPASRKWVGDLVEGVRFLCKPRDSEEHEEGDVQVAVKGL